MSFVRCFHVYGIYFTKYIFNIALDLKAFFVTSCDANVRFVLVSFQANFREKNML